MAVVEKRIKDSWHDEICDTTSCVTPSSCQGIGSTNDVLVKETSRPYLARDETTTKDSDEESNDIETCWCRDCASESSWERADEKAGGEGDARAEAITSRPSDQANEETGGIS